MATKVPIHGDISFGDLARECGLSEINTRRFVRYAIVFHRVFQEPRPGYVGHTAASRVLAEDPVMRDVLSHYLEECFPSFAMVVSFSLLVSSLRSLTRLSPDSQCNR